MKENHVVDFRHECHETAMFKGYFRRECHETAIVKGCFTKIYNCAISDMFTCLARTADHEFDNML